MFNKKQIKNLIILDTLILGVAVLLFGVNFYFAYIIRNAEVKETFVALSLLGIFVGFISLRTLIKDIKLLPKKAKKTEKVTLENPVTL